MVSKKIIIAGAVVVLGGGVLLANNAAKNSIGENVENAFAEIKKQLPEGVKMAYEVTKNEEEGTFSGNLAVAKDDVTVISKFNIEPSAFPLFNSNVKLTGDISVDSIISSKSELRGNFETEISSGQDEVKLTVNDVKGTVEGKILGDTLYGVLGQTYEIKDGTAEFEYQLEEKTYDATLNAGTVDYSINIYDQSQVRPQLAKHTIGLKDVAIKFSGGTNNTDRSITAKELVNGDTTGKNFKLAYNTKDDAGKTDVNLVFNGDFTNPEYSGTNSYNIDVDFKKLDNNIVTQFAYNEISPALTLHSLFNAGLDLQVNQFSITNDKTGQKETIEGYISLKEGSDFSGYYVLDDKVNFDLKINGVAQGIVGSLASMFSDETQLTGDTVSHEFKYDGKEFSVNGKASDDRIPSTNLPMLLNLPVMFLEHFVGVNPSHIMSVNFY